jgi:hypothetical protein
VGLLLPALGVGARRTPALTAGALALLDRVRQLLRDKRLEAVQQIERTQHARERPQRCPATALQPLQGRQRHTGLGGELPLRHVAIQPNSRDAAAKLAQDRAVS